MMFRERAPDTSMIKRYEKDVCYLALPLRSENLRREQVAKGDFCPEERRSCDLQHCTFRLSFYYFGAAIVISSAIATVVGIE